MDDDPEAEWTDDELLAFEWRAFHAISDGADDEDVLAEFVADGLSFEWAIDFVELAKDRVEEARAIDVRAGPGRGGTGSNVEEVMKALDASIARARAERLKDEAVSSAPAARPEDDPLIAPRNDGSAAADRVKRWALEGLRWAAVLPAVVGLYLAGHVVSYIALESCTEAAEPEPGEEPASLWDDPFVV